MNTENLNPCPLERPVGRRSGKEWLLAFALAFRSWLLNIRRNMRKAPIVSCNLSDWEIERNLHGFKLFGFYLFDIRTGTFWFVVLIVICQLFILNGLIDSGIERQKIFSDLYDLNKRISELEAKTTQKQLNLELQQQNQIQQTKM